MTRFKDWVPRRVIPAVLPPFRGDFSIDEPAYRRHPSDVATGLDRDGASVLGAE